MTAWTIAALVFPVLMAWCAISDMFTMRIPNLLTLAVIVSFAVIGPLAGLSLVTMGWHLALAVGVLVLTYLFFMIGVIGGGDAKMCAAIMLWMGPANAMEYGLSFAILGGALTLVMLLVKRFPTVPVLGSTAWYGRLAEPKSGVPYGIALAAGALIIYPQTQVYLALVGAAP